MGDSGKRGRFRVIYHVKGHNDIWMLTLYAKNEAASIPRTCAGRLLRMRSIAKTKRSVGQEILDGLRELERGEHGRVTTRPWAAAIRDKNRPTEARVFASARRARAYRFTSGDRAGERGRALLHIAAENPKALVDVA